MIQHYTNSKLPALSLHDQLIQSSNYLFMLYSFKDTFSSPYYTVSRDRTIMVCKEAVVVLFKVQF